MGRVQQTAKVYWQWHAASPAAVEQPMNDRTNRVLRPLLSPVDYSR